MFSELWPFPAARCFIAILNLLNFKIIFLFQNLGITQSQFNQAVTSNGYPTPTAAQYNAFVGSLSKGGIVYKLEAAMYLAQLIHESGIINNFFKFKN